MHRYCTLILSRNADACVNNPVIFYRAIKCILYVAQGKDYGASSEDQIHYLVVIDLVKQAC